MLTQFQQTFQIHIPIFDYILVPFEVPCYRYKYRLALMKHHTVQVLNKNKIGNSIKMGQTNTILCLILISNYYFHLIL
jgi:hypothetical protein